MDRLNQSEQRELNQRLERRQMKEMMTVSLSKLTSSIDYSLLRLDAPLLQNIATKAKLTHSSTQMYSKMVQRCFDDCVNDFTTKSLQSREEGCIMRCFDKSIKGGERIQQRFQEQNTQPMGGGNLGS